MKDLPRLAFLVDESWMLLSLHIRQTALSAPHCNYCTVLKSTMEVEAQPLLIEEDEKLGSLMYAQRPKKDSRLRSWVVAILTHGFVALLVLLAVIFSPVAGFIPYHELSNAKARPTLYCMFERRPLSLYFSLIRF